MARHRKASFTRWLIRFFIVVFSLLTLIALFNALVDGVGVFRLNAGLKYAAVNLAQGRMVAGRVGGWDERELQRMIVEQYAGRRDMIVIGSSRTMLLRKRFVPGNPDFMNHSLAGTCLEDMLSIVGLYKEKGVLPRMVVLAIDPWMFNRNAGLGRSWETLGFYYNQMLKELGGGAAFGRGPLTGKAGKGADSDRIAKLRQLINLEYTIQNWEYLRGGKKLRVVADAAVDDYVKEPDGSYHFPYKLRHLKMVKDGPGNAMPDTYFRDFTSLTGTEIFEGLVDYLRRKGVRVVFVLPPFHPHAYRSCFENAKYGITLKVEEYARDLAQKKGITLVGSYDPSQSGFTGEDFFDGTHGHEIVMRRFFENYR